MDCAINTTMAWTMYNALWGDCKNMYNDCMAIDTLMRVGREGVVQRCTTIVWHTMYGHWYTNSRQGYRLGGRNERQTTERRCLNPPPAIRPGLNTAHPHISKGQGRYKGGLVLQKAWHAAPSPVF